MGGEDFGMMFLEVADLQNLAGSENMKIAHNMPPIGSNTAQIRFQIVKEPPKEAPQRPTSFNHLKNECVWPSRLFASDELLKPQDGSKTAQEGPKRGPRAPKSAPIAPREGAQEAMFRVRTGGPY